MGDGSKRLEQGKKEKMFYYRGKAKGLRDRVLILKGKGAGDGESGGHQKLQEKTQSYKTSNNKKVRK